MKAARENMLRDFVFKRTSNRLQDPGCIVLVVPNCFFLCVPAGKWDAVSASNPNDPLADLSSAGFAERDGYSGELEPGRDVRSVGDNIAGQQAAADRLTRLQQPGDGRVLRGGLG